MKFGMLWRCSDDKNVLLSDKIKQAVDYYTEKYGVPTICHVNPKDYDPEMSQIHGVFVQPNRVVMKNYLWIGILDD